MSLQNVIDIEGDDERAQLVLRRAPIPEPAPGEVLIRVHAAGVNRADVKQRQGRYLMPPGAPSIPGLEAAGEVVACGLGAERWKVGDHVCALLLGGGYAQYCVAPHQQCLPLPAGLDFINAAALPEVAFTSWLALMVQSRLLPGETVLIHGGAGGVGAFSLQMARVFGCPVIATAGNDEKCRQCESLGASLTVNYKTGDLAQAVQDFTKGRGVDVIINQVGAPYLSSDLDMLAEGGRICLLSGDYGRQADFDIFKIMMKGASITGLRLRPRSIAEKGMIAGELERRVWPHIANGDIQSCVTKTYPLAEAAQAHSFMESGDSFGKLVLLPKQG